MKYTTFRGLLIGGGVLAVIGGIAGAALTCGGDSTTTATATATATAKNRPKQLPLASAGVLTAAPPTTSTDATSAPPTTDGTLRPVDTAVLGKIHTPLSGDKVKDAFPGATYKVSLYQDAGKTAPNRVKIDLDRDDKWDEKWTIETEDGKEKIKRQSAPNDDENYTLEYRLENQVWVPKKK